MRAGLTAFLAVVITAASASAQEPVRITLSRTACFGTCPVYTVSLSEDGRVAYEGLQHVRVSGKQTWTIDPAKVRALADDMEKAGFFEMRDEYTARVTDLPTVITTLTRGSRTKAVKDYFGAPPSLKELEQRIDDVSGVLRYVRSDKVSLEDALARGDAASVTRLLAAGADARSRDADGVTLVMKAALSGDPETVRAVLAAGGDPTARDLAGRNAADRVRDRLAREPRNPKLAEILRLLTDE
jgi:uncharacterized protein DUF6438